MTSIIPTEPHKKVNLSTIYAILGLIPNWMTIFECD